MPLSEHEQRLLEQMERALMAEDPKFATSLRQGSSGVDRRRMAFGVFGFLLGLALLLGGVATHPALGVVGFLVMLGSCLLIVMALRKPSKPAAEGAEAASAQTSETTAAPSRTRKGFMNRMEQRWQRRNREQGGD